MNAHQPSGLRHIWLCADDYGISAGVNTAIRDLIVRGRLNATSVLVAAPSFNRFEAQALNALNLSAPRVAIGLHFALTAPFRPLSQSFAPLRDGAFLPLADTLIAGMLHRFNPGMLEAEVRAQLEAFRSAFGRAPDFVDGHQHVHLLPQVSEAVLKVAKELAPQAWLRQCGRVSSLAGRLGSPKALVLDVLSHRFRRRAAATDVRTNPGFAGAYEFHDTADFAALFPRFLDKLPAGSVIMCHPGFVDDELQRLDPLTTLREHEYAYLIGDAFPGALAKCGVTLTDAAQSRLAQVVHAG
jgi:chitin disaccharide deacetylase